MSIKRISEKIDRILHLLYALIELLKPKPAVTGHFAGAFYTDPETGQITMATQTLLVGVAATAPLDFLDANGVKVAGPMGTVASTDANVSIALSADGQSANVLMSAPGTTATLTWSGTGGAGPFSFTVDVTDLPVIAAVSGSFGTFAAGTTA